MSKILVVTLAYNKVEYTSQMVRSLQNVDSGVEYELVIVNNASTDKTNEFLSPDNFKGIKARAIWNKKNKGFSIGNNQAIDLIKDNKEIEYYCFLNNDTIVTANWLKEMLECMERHKDAVIIGAKLIHPGTGRIQHAGVIEQNGHRPTHIYFGQDRYFPPANVEKKYPAMTGACILVKRDFFESVGGFDEAYWCGWEDIDLCKKATELGKEIWYAPKAEVYHYEGSSDGRLVAENQNFAIYSQRWTLRGK